MATDPRRRLQERREERDTGQLSPGTSGEGETPAGVVGEENPGDGDGLADSQGTKGKPGRRAYVPSAELIRRVEEKLQARHEKDWADGANPFTDSEPPEASAPLLHAIWHSRKGLVEIERQFEFDRDRLEVSYRSKIAPAQKRVAEAEARKKADDDRQWNEIVRDAAGKGYTPADLRSLLQQIQAQSGASGAG